MLADPYKVTAARAPQRQGKNADVRQILALEQSRILWSASESNSPACQDP